MVASTVVAALVVSMGVLAAILLLTAVFLLGAHHCVASRGCSYASEWVYMLLNALNASVVSNTSKSSVRINNNNNGSTPAAGAHAALKYRGILAPFDNEANEPVRQLEHHRERPVRVNEHRQ